MKKIINLNIIIIILLRKKRSNKCYKIEKLSLPLNIIFIYAIYIKAYDLNEPNIKL